MLDVERDSGAVDANGGAEGGNEQDQDQGGAQGDSGEKDQGGARANIADQYKRDMLKFKDRARVLEDELKREREAKLKEKEDWKSLAEQRESESKEWKEKFERGNSAWQDTQKHSAVHAAALKMGLRPEAEGDLELLDLDGVEVELTSTGRYRVANAEEFAATLKKSKPHWFKSAQVPKFNGGGGKEAPGDPELTASYMVQLERKDPKKFRELWPKFQEKLKAAKNKP